MPLQTLQVRLERRLTGDALEELVLRPPLRPRRPLELDVELALAADFRPMLALRGIVDVPAAAVDVAARRDGVALQRRHGATACAASTTVAADPAAGASTPTRGTLRWSLALEPGERACDAPALRARRRGADRSRPRAARPPPDGPAPRRGWPSARACARTTSSSTASLQRSLLDLRMLRSPLDGHEYYAAGVPWFATLFGRDSLITALEVAGLRPVRSPSRPCACWRARLGRRVDPVREEEPGKVLHELRVGEVAALGPHAARRATTARSTRRRSSSACSSSTPTGAATSTLFRELRGAVEAALGWIDRHGDHDGDGLLDYRASAPDGPAQPGLEGLRGRRPRRADGAPLEPPIALVEAQAYVVRAKRRLAGLFARDGDAAQRAGAWRRGRRPRGRASSASGSPSAGFYAMALDGEGRPSAALASNQGHLLWAGAVPPERARGVRDALMGEAMFSGWGIRTLGGGRGRLTTPSATTSARCGPTTPPWPRPACAATASTRTSPRSSRRCSRRRSHAEDYRLPELFAGVLARRSSRRRCPTPSRAIRRPGRPARSPTC